MPLDPLVGMSLCDMLCDICYVEKAVVFVLFREVLRNKIEKCSADVSLDIFTERRVVPDLSLIHI